MSSTAQGVTAVKECKFPPLFGYNTEVEHGAVRTLSTVNFANLTVKNEKGPSNPARYNFIISRNL